MIVIKELGTEVLSSFRTLSTMVAHTVFIAVFINPPFEGYVAVIAVRTPPSSPYVTLYRGQGLLILLAGRRERNFWKMSQKCSQPCPPGG